MCNNSLLFVCEIYDRQDMTVSIVRGLMIFHYFAKNAIVTIIGRIYFLFTYQFLLMFFVGTDICEKESLVSEETGISEENPRVRAVDPRTHSHPTTTDPGDRTRSARSKCIVHCTT